MTIRCHDVELDLLNHSCGVTNAGRSGGLINESPIARSVLVGDFEAALQHVGLASLLRPPTCGAEQNAEIYYTGLRRRVQATFDACQTGGSKDLQQMLSAGVAALQIFVQHNLTGPIPPLPHQTPLQLFTSSFAESADLRTSPSPSRVAAAPPPSSVSSTSDKPTPQDSNSIPDTSGIDTTPLPALGDDNISADDCWAMQQLQLDGEDIVGLCQQLQYLLLAEIILVEPLTRPQPQQQQSQAAPATPAESDTPSLASAAATSMLVDIESSAARSIVEALPTLPWWALRVTVLHQSVLAGRSATLLRRTNMLTRMLQPTLASAESSHVTSAVETSTPSAGCSGWLSPALAVVLSLELGLAQMSYGYVDAARGYLHDSEAQLGFTVSLTGALGKRTVHQIDDKAQLVVSATRTGLSHSASSSSPAAASEAADADHLMGEQAGSSEAGVATRGTYSVELAVAGMGFEGGVGCQDLEGLQDDSDVFLAPALASEAGSANGVNVKARYTGLEQSLLLAQAVLVKKGTAHDDLQEWEMAPYVEAVLTQTTSHFMLQAAGRLLKARHERSRPRTRERALLVMEQLSEALLKGHDQDTAAAVAAASASAAATQQRHQLKLAAVRQRLAYSVSFPLQVVLRKELAEHYVSLGFVGAAIRMFEILHLWDPLISCYRMMGKSNLADELIRRRLVAQPKEARLWCALGDLHMEDSHYETAWEVSEQRNTRSQRSLGRSALRNKQYPKAVTHYQLALALNPLHPEAWFSLGFCFMKLGEKQQALTAYTHVTQQEPDNGEAWNNVATLWLALGKHKEAFISLGEALRHKRDSWQMWDNYGQAALASGNHDKAARAIKQVLDLTGSTKVNMSVLHGLIDIIAPPPATSSSAAQSEASANSSVTDHTEMQSSAAAEEQQVLSDLKSSQSACAPGDEDDGFVLDGDILLGLSLGGNGNGSESSSALPDAASDATMEEASESAVATSQDSGRESASAVPLTRAQEQLRVAVNQVLKEVLNGPACSAEAWGLLAQVHRHAGDREACKEALLKQVRALQGTSFKSDPVKFETMAKASLALCSEYVYLSHAATATSSAATSAVSGSSSSSDASNVAASRNLSSARMHLRGLLKQCEGAFQGNASYVLMEELLQEVLDLEKAGAVATTGSA